jgi:hypothetical protein
VREPEPEEPVLARVLAEPVLEPEEPEEPERLREPEPVV